MLSRRLPFILLPILLIGCTPPLIALKSSGAVTVEVSIRGYHPNDPEAKSNFENGVRAALAQELVRGSSPPRRIPPDACPWRCGKRPSNAGSPGGAG